jgi:3-hydroxybutyryl-CoA dehydrogenase
MSPDRSPINRVFVAGAGLMGHGIAQILAVSGRPVTLYEPDLERAVQGRVKILGNLERAVSKDRMRASERDATMQRLAVTSDPSRVRGADLVIEAVFEDVDVKSKLWSSLDELASAHTVFASNTSSISIDRLAESVSEERRSRFLGMHFFSPVPVMPLVEIIRGTATDDATADRIRTLATQLDKQVIVANDRPGFIVNRVLMPFLAEAMRVYEEGTGTAEDVDTGAKIGLNHPMGPLELADFIGLDVCLNILRVLHEGLGGEHFAPPKVLVDLVGEGKLGQKSGEGFYTYSAEATVSAESEAAAG